MSLPHKSVATIDAPEFINLQPLDINPMMSKCEIKVFYVGENRNGSFIKKEVATEMAKTLRGAPIVGYYKEEKGDYADHGEVVTIDDEGVHFECKTFPYGFVAPDAQVWFQKFNDEDDFGNAVEREYLMTTGYLWTGQFPESQSVVDDGKPQSMELDENSLDGHWAENSKNGKGFFIINDAVVSKLCILGDDVEPCFEGACITSPTTNTSFSLDKNFKNTLFSMMKDLEFALKGDNTVNDAVNTVAEPEQAPVAENFSAENDAPASSENNVPVDQNAEFAQKKEDPKKEPETGSDEGEGEEGTGEDKEKEKKPETKNSLHTDEEYAALETQFTELKNKFEALEAENASLVEFKNNVEDKQKDELIEKFFMLSDEDKKDVIENKRNYSLEDIESKFAVICFRKGINFNAEAAKEKEAAAPVVTFDMTNNAAAGTTSDWVAAVEAIQNRI